MWTFTDVLTWLWAMVVEPLNILLRLMGVSLVLVAFVGLSAGCTITTTDDGSMGIKFEQGVTIWHIAKETGKKATAGIDGKPLVDHLVTLKDKGIIGGGDDAPTEAPE